MAPPHCCKVEVEVMGSKPPCVKLTNKNINCVKISSALKNNIQPYLTKNLLQHLSYMLILLSNLVNEEEMVGKFCLSQTSWGLKCPPNLIELSIWSVTFFFIWSVWPLNFQTGKYDPSIREQIDSFHKPYIYKIQFHWNRKAYIIYGMHTRIKPSCANFKGPIST